MTEQNHHSVKCCGGIVDDSRSAASLFTHSCDVCFGDSVMVVYNTLDLAVSQCALFLHIPLQYTVWYTQVPGLCWWYSDGQCVGENLNL